MASLVKYMGVNHCGTDILVAQKFLNSPDIIPVFKEVCSKAVSEGMTTNPLDDSGTYKKGTGYFFIPFFEGLPSLKHNCHPPYFIQKVACPLFLSEHRPRLYKNVGVYHRGFNFAMAEQFLDGPDVVSLFSNRNRYRDRNRDHKHSYRMP